MYLYFTFLKVFPLLLIFSNGAFWLQFWNSFIIIPSKQRPGVLFDRKFRKFGMDGKW